MRFLFVCLYVCLFSESFNYGGIGSGFSDLRCTLDTDPVRGSEQRERAGEATLVWNGGRAARGPRGLSAGERPGRNAVTRRLLYRPSGYETSLVQPLQ